MTPRPVLLLPLLISTFFSLAQATHADSLRKIGNYPLFDSYQEFRATLDPIAKQRQIVRFIEVFGGQSKFTPEQAALLESQIKSVVPVDLNQSEVILSRPLSDTWTQEVYAYWTGASYLYFYALLHQRADGILAVQVVFNTQVANVLAPVK